MVLFITICQLFLPIILGNVLIRIFDRENVMPPLFRYAIGYGLGTGIVCQIMIVLAHLHIRYTAFNINAIIIILLVICLLLHSKFSLPSRKLSFPKPNFKNNTFFFLGWIIVFVSVSSSFFLALLKPITAWDAVSAIGFVAKVIFFDGGLENISRFPHSYYPLHVPLLESWLAISAGVFDGQSVKIIFPLYYLSLIVGAYYFFKVFTNSGWALLGVLCIISSNFVFFHTTIGYRDFTLMYYNFCTVALLLLWMKKESWGFLVLASLFAGITSLVKMEGTLFLPIYVVAVLIIAFLQKRNAWGSMLTKVFVFCLGAFGQFMLFHTYRIKMGLTMGQKTELFLSWNALERIPSILQAIVHNLFLSANWSLVWIVLVFSVLRWRQAELKKYAIMTLFLLCLFFGLIVAYGTFTSSYPWIGGEHQHLTLSRVILHFFPVSVIAIIFLNAPVIAKNP